jgi:hypothetical protein
MAFTIPHRVITPMVAYPLLWTSCNFFVEFCLLLWCVKNLPFQQLKYMFIIKQQTNKWYVIFLECQFFPKIPCSIWEKSMMCKLSLVRSMLCMWGAQVVIVHIWLANKSTTCIYMIFWAIYGGDDLTMYKIHPFNDYMSKKVFFLQYKEWNVS